MIIACVLLKDLTFSKLAIVTLSKGKIWVSTIHNFRTVNELMENIQITK